MSDEKEKPWVVMEGGGAKCLRCGATLRVELPCRVEDWCDAIGAFDRRHQQCEKPEVHTSVQK